MPTANFHRLRWLLRKKVPRGIPEALKWSTDEGPAASANISRSILLLATDDEYAFPDTVVPTFATAKEFAWWKHPIKIPCCLGEARKEGPMSKIQASYNDWGVTSSESLPWRPVAARLWGTSFEQGPTRHSKIVCESVRYRTRSATFAALTLSPVAPLVEAWQLSSCFQHKLTI